MKVTKTFHFLICQKSFMLPTSVVNRKCLYLALRPDVFQRNTWGIWSEICRDCFWLSMAHFKPPSKILLIRSKWTNFLRLMLLTRRCCGLCSFPRCPCLSRFCLSHVVYIHSFLPSFIKVFLGQVLGHKRDGQDASLLNSVENEFFCRLTDAVQWMPLNDSIRYDFAVMR